MKIVLKELAELPHPLVQLVFARVPKRRMTQIVGKGESFSKFLVQLENRGNCAGDLSHLEGMGEAVTEVVAQVRCEDLGFPLHPAKRAGMDDAVAVTLEVVAIRMRKLRKSTPSGPGKLEAKGTQHSATRARNY